MPIQQWAVVLICKSWDQFFTTFIFPRAFFLKAMIKFLVTTTLIAFNWTTADVVNSQLKPRYSTILSSEKGKAVLEQCSRQVPDSIDSFWGVNQNEVQNLERNLKKISSLRSTGCCIVGAKIPKFKKYGFQYIGVEIKKKRYIYINAFEINSVDDFDIFYKNWQTEPIIVCDGGASFWGPYLV